MFCHHCGAQNPDGVTFCGACGKPVADSTQRNSRQTTRNTEVMELERMIRYFSQKAAEYEEYDRLGAQIRSSKGKHVSLLVWGIIAVCIGFTIIGLASGSSDDAFKLIVASAVIVPGAAMIVGHIFYAKNYDKKAAQTRSRYEALGRELMDYYQAYGVCSVGAEYTNPANLAAIRDTILSGRADTIKEAINVLVDDAYRNSMQQYAAQTALNTAAAARGAKASAVFAAANFFIKK